MYYFAKKLNNLFVGIFIILLAACGGGGSSVQTSGIDRSGSPATSTSGPISGFGSVIVNGVRYHSDKANITASDDAATENDLHAGLQVNITGTLNTDGTGDATSIDFFPDVVGKITAIDTSANQITVLGQTILINNSTLFSANITPNFIDGLKVDDTVQVSGQLNSQNILVATRIDLVTSSVLRIKGKVSSIDPVNFKFMINNLVVNYAGANQKDFNGANLANNLTVFVKASGLNNQNELIAQSIKLMPNTVRTDSKHAELAGFITRFASATDFDIGNVTCTTNAITSFENGTATNLALGTQIEIVGDVNGAGVLVATKIHLQEKENTSTAGIISNVQSNTSGAIATGSFVLDGVTVQINSLTRVEDKSETNLKKFNASDLKAGDFVKVSGFISGTTLVATQIERNTLQTDNDLRIQGIITAALTDSFNINDRHILINAQTELRGLNGETLTSVAFAAIALGKNVEVRGTLSSGVFTATRVEMHLMD